MASPGGCIRTVGPSELSIQTRPPFNFEAGYPDFQAPGFTDFPKSGNPYKSNFDELAPPEGQVSLPNGMGSVSTQLDGPVAPTIETPLLPRSPWQRFVVEVTSSPSKY